MITQIPTPQRTNNRVMGEFYPLQKDELIALRQAKLINNAAFVHLALRSENPFCDRPVEIRPKEFALSWNIPESSIYKAIARVGALRPLDPEQSISTREGDMVMGNREQKNISDSEPEQVITVASKNNEPVEDNSIVVTDEFGNSARYKTYSQEEAEKIPVNEGFKKRLDQWLKSMRGRGHSCV